MGLAVARRLGSGPAVGSTSDGDRRSCARPRVFILIGGILRGSRDRAGVLRESQVRALAARGTPRPAARAPVARPQPLPRGRPDRRHARRLPVRRVRRRDAGRRPVARARSTLGLVERCWPTASRSSRVTLVIAYVSLVARRARAQAARAAARRGHRARGRADPRPHRASRPGRSSGCCRVAPTSSSGCFGGDPQRRRREASPRRSCADWSRRTTTLDASRSGGSSTRCSPPASRSCAR